MNVKHEFMIVNSKIIIDETYQLIIGDYCCYCNLIVDEVIENIFNSHLEFKKAFSEINEKYQCLTEEEFLIKKALE